MATPIKEFLATLGFTVDHTSERRFSDSLENATKGVRNLGLALSGAVASIGFATVKISSDFEKLYWLSQRTGASAGFIKSFESAISRLGGTAEGARASIGAIGDFVDRFGAGATGFFKQLGLDVSSTDAMLTGLFKLLKTAPQTLAITIADFIGMDIDTLRAVRRNVDDLMSRSRGIAAQAGIDYQRITTDAMLFMNQVRDLLEVLGVLKNKVLADLYDKYGLKLQSLTQYLIANIPAIADRIGMAIDRLYEFGLQVDSLVQGIGGWKNALTGLAVFFGSSWLAAMLVPIITLGAAIGVAFAPILAVMAAGAAGWWLGGKIGDLLDQAKAQAADRPGQKGLPRGMRQNNPGNLRSWGATPVEGGFAKFGSGQEGLSAMAGQLLRYGARGTDTVNEIISRWAPSSENNTEAYARAVASRLGVSSDKTLDLRDPSTLTGLMGAMIRHEQGYDPFSLSELHGAATARLGTDAMGRSVSINQNTEINVNGSDEPAAIGTAIAGQQRRVNEDMVRNFRGVVR